MALSERDLEDLRQAKQLLEHPSLAARATALIGTPIERGFALLPAVPFGLHTAVAWVCLLPIYGGATSGVS